MALAALFETGCRDSLSGFGAGLRGRASAEQVFGGLADRHLEIVRNAKFDYARVQLSRGALSPSRVFDDTAAWTAVSGNVRLLETFGSTLDGKYVMNSHRGVPAPAKAGDGRHLSTLSKVSDNQYHWDTSVDFALGSAHPNDVALVVARLLAAGEGLTDKDARAELAATTPRASAVLGNLFTLDSLHPVQLGDGTTAVSLVVSIKADLLKAKYPAFADYVHKYVDPARWHLVVNDRSGATYLDALQKDRVVSVRLRSQNGHLVPLSGPPRAMPDTLTILADFTVKLKVFTVGFHELSLDFVNAARGDQERSWTVTAHKEPQWNLPFITARLIRAPLRYPFANEGALFRMALRAGEGDQPTVLVRQTRLGVQESAILKFINSLSSSAMDDLGARVEHEENQWLREIFIAMRDDSRAVYGP